MAHGSGVDVADLGDERGELPGSSDVVLSGSGSVADPS